jgi:L-seryl-tRNA(Ser) seleniumtransferase
MLVAVESWVKRDHDAEWKEWVGRCEQVATRLASIPGVKTAVRGPEEGLSNRSPSLSVRWDSSKLGITGTEVADILYTTEPRIALNGSRAGSPAPDGSGDTGITIVAAMMLPGDEKVVGQRVADVLSAKHSPKPAEEPAPPAANIAGRWDVEIQYAASSTIHRVYLQQNGNRLEGAHQGNFLNRDIAGTINGDAVALASNVAERHGDALTYRFSGKVAGDTMSGTLDLGEYRAATWIARRPAAPNRTA